VNDYYVRAPEGFGHFRIERMDSKMRATNIQASQFVLLIIFLWSATVTTAEMKDSSPAPPAVHHILLEVSNVQASIKFYRNVMGLQPKSLGNSFSTLEAANVGIYLSTSPWGWKPPRNKDERLGLGMYPHFEVADVQETVDRIKNAGYKIIQEPKIYSWGTEAFVADPDGYTWALISLPGHQQ
jgi:predicted enzyme related to lactoylglutathione lyase